MAKAVQPGLVVDQGIPFPSLKGGSIPLEAGLRVFQDFKPCDPPGKGPVNLCSSEKNIARTRASIAFRRLAGT